MIVIQTTKLLTDDSLICLDDAYTLARRDASRAFVSGNFTGTQLFSRTLVTAAVVLAFFEDAIYNDGQHFIGCV